MEIRENLLFGGISQENIDKILVCSKSNIKRYAQGEKVFFQGDEPRRLFVLLKGRVKFVKNLFSGKKQFLDEACEGGIFGESCFLGEEACYGYDAEAACETEVLEIPWEYFHCFCDNTCSSPSAAYKKYAGDIIYQRDSGHEENKHDNAYVIKGTHRQLAFRLSGRF